MDSNSSTNLEMKSFSIKETAESIVGFLTVLKDHGISVDYMIDYSIPRLVNGYPQELK